MKNWKNLLSILIALIIICIPTSFIISYVISGSVKESGNILLQIVLYVILSGILLALINRLSNDFVVNLSNLLIENISHIFEGYENEYREFAESRNQYFDTMSLSFRGEFNPELIQVYVDLRLMPANSTTDSPGKLIWEYLPHAKKKVGNKLVIIGDPGCGKTTLLRHISLMLAKHSDNSLPLKLPVFLNIRDIQKCIEAAPNTGLQTVILSSLGSRIKNAPNDWFESRLIQGKFIILLDGLDEIADPIARIKVVEWVQKQIIDYKENDFVITSRPHGYDSNPLIGVEKLIIKPFDLVQVREFINKWYIANELTRARKDDRAVRWLAEDKARDLLRAIQNKPALAELALNPLLATMIATIHSFKGILPERRSDLYRDIFEVVLKKRIEYWHSVQLRTEQAITVLKYLAYNMMMQRRRNIPLHEAAALISSELSKTDS
jgi:predicted NACHT family NTPase